MHRSFLEKSAAFGPEMIADEKVAGRVPIFLNVRTKGSPDWPVCVELKVRLAGLQASAGVLLFCWDAVTVKITGKMERLV